MPTRLNKTSIGISDEIKAKLESYINPERHGSWDDFMSDVLILIESDALEDND